MRYFIIALTIFCLISCDYDDETKGTEKCTLTDSNAILNLKTDGFVMDTVRINFKGNNYELVLQSGYITQKFYDYKLNSKSILFGKDNEDISCRVSIYYPGDSSYFNNVDFLSTFKVRDSNVPFNRTADSLVYVSQCSFNLYIEVSTDGQVFKSTDKSISTLNFFQVDSLKFIRPLSNEVARFKLHGHFSALLRNPVNSDDESISGTIQMQFDTRKQ